MTKSVEQERLIQRHDNLMNVNNLTIVGLQPFTDYHVDVSTVRKRDDKRPARDSVRVTTSEHSEWANTAVPHSMNSPVGAHSLLHPRHRSHSAAVVCGRLATAHASERVD